MFPINKAKQEKKEMTGKLQEKKEAAGNLKVFFGKIAWLQNKWAGVDEHMGDREELRLMGSVLSKTSSPVNLSIVADNIGYFEKHYNDEYGDNLTKALKLACLCGSRTIADFLLDKLGSCYDTEGYEFVLSYASASMNTDWVIEIASSMKAQQLPIGVYGICDDELLLSKLQAIFGESLEKKYGIQKKLSLS